APPWSGSGPAGIAGRPALASSRPAPDPAGRPPPGYTASRGYTAPRRPPGGPPADTSARLRRDSVLPPTLSCTSSRDRTGLPGPPVPQGARTRAAPWRNPLVYRRLTPHGPPPSRVVGLGSPAPVPR